jgi:hypothetical protein
LNADPQITGKIFSAMVALRMPALDFGDGQRLALRRISRTAYRRTPNRFDHLLAV